MDLAFTAQAHGLVSDLETALAAVNSPELIGMGSRVVERFGKTLEEARDSAAALRDRGAEAGSAGLWTTLNTKKDEAQSLISEASEFIHGVLLRRAGLDHGLADVADVLIDDLADRTHTSWSRLTIFSDEPHTTPTTDIVRLKFPSFRIWALPLVAHEFGHSLVDMLRDIDGRDKEEPVRAYLDAMDGPDSPIDVARPHAEELFCDLFAVYSMGPAAALSLALYELDPAHPAEPTASHPAASDRFSFITAALETLGRRDGDLNRYASIGRKLEESWASSLHAADQAVAAGSSDLDAMLTDLLHLLDRHTGPRTRFDSWLSAQQLDTDWHSDVVAMTIADVVNAAWLRRLRLPASDWLELEAEALDRALQTAFTSTPEA